MVEREDIKIGETLYLFKLDISYHQRINLGIAAEVKVIGEEELEVTRVINGKVLKVGEKINIKDYRIASYRTTNLFKSMEEGAEWWNARLRNAEDGLTSEYERKKKAILKRLITI